MAEGFDFNNLKEGTKNTLLTTFKAYGTAVFMKEINRALEHEKHPENRVKIALTTLLSLWAAFRIKMKTGNERGSLNQETEYEDFGGLKHYIYAGFSQLTYLDWFKANDNMKELIINKLITDNQYFNIIRSDSYKTYYTSDKDYKYLISIDGGDPVKIYDGEDKRIYFLYSENMKDSEKEKKFPELQQWQFVYAFDHEKIYKYMSENLITKRALHEIKEGDSKRGSYPNWRTAINEVSSDFQAAVFKHEKTKKVMIAYRGTDPSHWEDWILTNFKLGTKGVPEALTCAVWVYEKVATDPDLKDYEIHVTGHSMGGALAQYIAVYGFRPIEPTIYEEYGKDGLKVLPFTRPVHKTVTFNGLGIDRQYKTVINNDREKHYEIYRNNFFGFMNAENKVLNFYMQNDGVSDIQIGVGKSVMVDTVKPQQKPNFQVRIFGNDLAGYHSVSAFLPYIHNGNIVRNKLTRNHVLNAIKQTILTEKQQPMKALFGSKKGNNGLANTFKEKVSKSPLDFTNKEFIKNTQKENQSSLETAKNSGFIKVKPEESYYLEEEFQIPYIDFETPIGNIYDAMVDKEEANGNIFYYMMPYNYDRERSDWYVYNDNEKIAEIGSFNNAVSIVGVEGGPPLRIKLPEDVTTPPKDLERRQENFYVNRLGADSVQGFNFISYSKFIMTQEIGRHNAFVLEGRISEEEYKKSEKSKYQEKEIAITPFNTKENNSDIEKSLLIRGIIKRIEFRKESPVDYFLKIHGISKSYLMDKQKKNKTFFNKEKFYTDLLSEMQSDYESLDFLNNNSEQKLGKAFIQYEESDWEFLKRVCSNLGISCIVDRCTTKKNEDDNSENKQNIYLGYYDNNSNENIEKISFFDDKVVSKNTNGTVIARLDKILKVGAYIKKDIPPVNKEQGKTDKDKQENSEDEKSTPEFMIKRIEAKLEKDVINYYYTLVPNNEDIKIIKPYYNKKIAGRTLQAVIRGVKEITNITEKVKDNKGFLSLNLDLPNFDDFENSKMNNDNLEETYLYPMNSSYSANSSGEFISPNVKNHVMLHFPNNNEDDAQVIPGIRKKSNSELHNPANKVIGVDSGQGIILNKEQGVSILGNSFHSPNSSTSMIHIKPQGAELHSEKNVVGMDLNGDIIKIFAKESGIEFTENSILIKNRGTAFEVSSDSINGLDGSLKMEPNGINTKNMIIV